MKPMAKHYVYKKDLTKFTSMYDVAKFKQVNSAVTSDDFECIFEPFEGFKFTREQNVDYEEAIRQRLLEIRNYNKKFNFWYSGGMDSHIILYYMKKFNIWPDQIYNHDTFPEFSDVMQHQESKVTREVLENYEIPNSVEITYLDLDHTYYKNMIEDDAYWNVELDSAHPLVFQLTMMSTCLIHKYKPFNLDFNNETNLMGATYPKLRYRDGIWFINMNSGVIDGQKWSENLENFLISSPEFTNIYFNAVIDFFEKQRYNETELHKIETYGQRKYKGMIDIGDHLTVFKECPEIMKRDKFLRQNIDIGNSNYNRIINYHFFGNSPKDYDLFMKLTERKIDWWPRFLDKSLQYEEEYFIGSTIIAPIQTKNYIINDNN